MSTQIELERKDYYQQLESAQRGNVDITAWLEWFLACLDRAITNADNLLAGVLAARAGSGNTSSSMPSTSVSA